MTNKSGHQTIEVSQQPEGKYLTLDELADFCRSAIAQGASGTTPVSVRLKGMKWLQKVTVSISKSPERQS